MNLQLVIFNWIVRNVFVAEIRTNYYPNEIIMIFSRPHPGSSSTPTQNTKRGTFKMNIEMSLQSADR